MLDKLCAVCSIVNRTAIAHPSQLNRDDQKCDAYRSRCFRCASKTHKTHSCFMESFKIEKNLCFTCGLRKHGGGQIHTRSNYGNRQCPHRNAIRFIVCLYEDTELWKLFTQTFTPAHNISSAVDFVKWVRETDNEGHTWYADVIKWINIHILNR